MCIDARDVFISIYIYSSPFFAAGNKRESGRGGKGVFSMNITRTDSHTHTQGERGCTARLISKGIIHDTTSKRD